MQQPTQFIDLTGRLQVSLIPAKPAAEAQARVVIIQQGQVATQCLIPVSQMDVIVQSWRRARIEFPGEDWSTPPDPPPGSPLLPSPSDLLQQLQSLKAIEATLGDTSAAESYCEDCCIDGNTVKQSRLPGSVLVLEWQ